MLSTDADEKQHLWAHGHKPSNLKQSEPKPVSTLRPPISGSNQGQTKKEDPMTPQSKTALNRRRFVFKTIRRSWPTASVSRTCSKG